MIWWWNVYLRISGMGERAYSIVDYVGIQRASSYNHKYLGAYTCIYFLPRVNRDLILSNYLIGVGRVRLWMQSLCQPSWKTNAIKVDRGEGHSSNQNTLNCQRQRNIQLLKNTSCCYRPWPSCTKQRAYFDLPTYCILTSPGIANTPNPAEPHSRPRELGAFKQHITTCTGDRQITPYKDKSSRTRRYVWEARRSTNPRKRSH